MRTQIISLALFLHLISSFASAQWVQVNGPTGDFITAFSGIGNTLLAGTHEGTIYRSTDGGVAWTTVFSTSLGAISCFASGGSNTFAGVAAEWGANEPDGGVFVSTDNGVSWEALSDFDSKRLPVSCLVLEGATLFAGICWVGNGPVEHSLYRSDNNGSSWTTAEYGLVDSLYVPIRVHALVAKGDTLFAGTTHGVFVSTNKGNSWTPFNFGLREGKNAAWLLNVGSLYVHGPGVYAGALGGIFLCKDNDPFWTVIDTSAEGVNLMTADGTTLYASNGTILRSTDSGTTWRTVEFPPWRVTTLVANRAGLFAGTNRAGIFCSTDSGTSWTHMSNGMREMQINTLYSTGTRLYAGTTEGGGVYRSTDGGMSWTSNSMGLERQEYMWGDGGVPVNCFLHSGSNLFVGIHGGPLSISTDGGMSWRRSNDGLPYTGVNALAASPPPDGAGSAYMFAACGGAFGSFGAGWYRGCGVFRSTDDGVNWTPANHGLPRSNDDTTEFGEIPCLLTLGQHLFAGTGSGIYRSTDNGSNWTTGGLMDTSIRALAVTSNTGGIGSSNLFAGTGVGVYLSTNCGTSWRAVNNGLASSHVHALAAKGSTLFALVDTSVFLSTNNCESWTTVTLGMRAVYSIEIHGADLFAATESSVWRRPLSEMTTTAGPVTSELPNEFSLSQNYPNPFNSTTTIKYGLPKSAEVRLSVYDMLGREVSLLVNERKDAGGYEVEFDASSLSSGMYFCRFRARDFAQTNRLMLLK